MVLEVLVHHGRAAHITAARTEREGGREWNASMESFLLVPLLFHSGLQPKG
jgi:hypothetical protein